MTISRIHRAFARRFGSLARVLAFVLLQSVAAGAFAHASLIETAPADGAMLHSAPSDLSLTFNEPVGPLVFTLLLPDGSTQPITQIATIPNGLKAHLPALPLQGSYLFSWRVVSADGHPVGGSTAFSVGVRSAARAGADAGIPAAASTPPLLMAAIWLTRLCLYLALFAGVGAMLFRACFPVMPQPPSGWIRAVLLAGVALLPLALGLQGLDALALPWPALSTWAPWQTALATSYGASLRLMLAALIAAGLAGFAGRRIGAMLSVCAVLLLGAALAASGHAASAPPQWLARPTVFLHAVSIVAWAGSLLPLLRLLRGARDATALLRFSRVIPWVLALLLISGAILALLQLDGVSTLWSTAYGRVLSAKLALVLVLLGVAALNRYALTGGVRRGDARARLWMRRLIGIELALVAMVLALVSVWRFTPPPRAVAAMSAMPVTVQLHAQKAMVDLTLTPQRDRRIGVKLFVQGHDFGMLDAKEVMVEFSNPALGIEPLRKDARPGAEMSNWTMDLVALPAPGRWHVRVDVLISDFEREQLDKDIDIAF
jgi:copper transport protein